MQPFLLQIRDATTHKVRPGILVGDVGPKLGFNTIGTKQAPSSPLFTCLALLSDQCPCMMMPDNGFMQLNHVRVPRGQKLNRFSEVTADGQFKRNNVSKGGRIAAVVCSSTQAPVPRHTLTPSTVVWRACDQCTAAWSRRDPCLSSCPGKCSPMPQLWQFATALCDASLHAATREQARVQERVLCLPRCKCWTT